MTYDMDETKNQKLIKLIKLLTKILPLFVVFFFLAMYPLPHPIRLIGFIVSLAFVFVSFFIYAILVYILVKKKSTLNEKAHKIAKILAIVFPILQIVFLIILLFFIYPEI